MTLSARLWLWGGVVPALVVGLVLLLADRAFHRALERSVDQALLTQAAIESVSLFDGPKNEPHLHMATSPLVETVRPFAPEGVLFGPDGKEVMRYPPPLSATAPERQEPGEPERGPSLSTREHGEARQRVLSVTVRAPTGALYTLRLTASLAQVDASARGFHVVAVLATAFTALVLAVVQALQGRGLRRRLATLRGHLEAVRAGELDRRLAPDTAGDEVSSIHEVLGQATERLQLARNARERLIADAAHELRTPLSLMRTRLDLALRRERAPDELKAALSDTREEVIRLAALATRLLDTAATAKAPLDGEPVDLVEIARASLSSVEASAAAAGVRLQLEQQGPVHLTGSPGMLRQVIDNLVSNALKVSPAGGAVTVKASREGPNAVVAIRDEGPGIPEAEREAVFEPFHRVRGGPPGTGLGLSIVRDVATRHGGRAWVASTAAGAEVVVELPLSPPSPAAS
ncbi:MAG: HAMP domain-containing histidine kinase [Myxococcaceae bacterium]|nr:HAMP domain-containing histidine kinase [Myxococcaceae bacterium]